MISKKNYVFAHKHSLYNRFRLCVRLQTVCVPMSIPNDCKEGKGTVWPRLFMALLAACVLAINLYIRNKAARLPIILTASMMPVVNSLVTFGTLLPGVAGKPVVSYQETVARVSRNVWLLIGISISKCFSARYILSNMLSFIYSRQIHTNAMHI